MTTEVRSLSSSFSMVSFFRVRLNSLEEKQTERGQKTYEEDATAQRSHEPADTRQRNTARFFYPPHLMLAQLGNNTLKKYLPENRIP